MKSIKIIICALFSLFFIGCIKEEEKKQTDDYRDKWCGNYECLVKEDGFVMITTDSCRYSSSEYTETVSVTKYNDSLIRLLDVKVKIDPKTGAFVYDYDIDPEADYSFFYGSFSNDSMYIEAYNGGRGAGTDYYYRGVKQ